MINLIFPTKTFLEGPWLISPKSLGELDAIIDEYCGKLEARRTKLLRNDTNEFKKKYEHLESKYRKEVNRQIRYYKEQSIYSRSRRLFHIYLQDAPTYTCESFNEAFRERYLLDKKPTGFGIDVLSGDIRCQVRIELSSPDLEINIEPEEATEAQEIYTSVYQWAIELRRHAIGHRIWGKFANHGGKIIVAGLLLYSFLFGMTQNAGVTDLRQQLSDLQRQGITESNVAEAVNLLILLQNNEIILTPWLIIYPIILLYLALVLFIRPRVVIGIGKGRDSLIFWRIWQTAALGIPALIVVNIVFPFVVEWLRSIFP
jgi:hypothetical protein